MQVCFLKYTCNSEKFKKHVEKSENTGQGHRHLPEKAGVRPRWDGCVGVKGTALQVPHQESRNEGKDSAQRETAKKEVTEEPHMHPTRTFGRLHVPSPVSRARDRGKDGR